MREHALVRRNAHRRVRHLIHEVVQHVTVHPPRAGVPGDEFDVARLAWADRDRHVLPARRTRNRAAARPHDLENVAVQMDRMEHQAQIGEPDSDTVALLHFEVGERRRGVAVEGGERRLHGVHVRVRVARAKAPLLEHDGEVLVDARLVLPCVDDEHAAQPEPLLLHHVEAGVVHQRPWAQRVEFVHFGCSGHDRLARLERVIARGSVLREGKLEPVPVDRRGFRQLVAQHDTHAVAFGRFQRRPGATSVIAPSQHGLGLRRSGTEPLRRWRHVRVLQARRVDDGGFDRLGDEFEDFHPVVDVVPERWDAGRFDAAHPAAHQTRRITQRDVRVTSRKPVLQGVHVHRVVHPRVTYPLPFGFGTRDGRTAERGQSRGRGTQRGQKLAAGERFGLLHPSSGSIERECRRSLIPGLHSV